MTKIYTKTDYYETIRYYKDEACTILHREDGPACEYTAGNKEWWINGNLHREDGPAIEWSDESKEWWFNGKRHRINGPAIENFNGSKKWFINGKQYSEVEYYIAIGRKNLVMFL